MAGLTPASLAAIYAAAGVVDCAKRGVIPQLPRDAEQLLWRNALLAQDVPAPDVTGVDHRDRFMLYARSVYDRARMFDAFRQHKNIFLTGEGGTGKTEDIKVIVDILQEVYSKKPSAFHVTATTALAAQPIKGGTFHAWAGLRRGMDTMTPGQIARSLDRWAIGRWRSTEVLVLDEVSMLSPNLFVKLDAVGRLLRENPWHPFGGIQLVFSGDFAQLPPVPDKDIPGSGRPLCVRREFTDAFPVVVYKKFQWRSATDPVYSALLSDLRLGNLGPDQRAVLGTRYRVALDAFCLKGIEPTEMFPTNREVDAANSEKIRMHSEGKAAIAARTASRARNTLAFSGPDADATKAAIADAKDAHEASVARTYIMQIAVARSADRHVQSGAVSRNVEPAVRQDVGDTSRALSKAVESCRGRQQVSFMRGTQVMLVANIDKRKGHVNGSRGVVLDPAVEAGGVLVRFADDSEVVIKPYKWETENVRSARNVIIDIVLTQIPLVLGYAITVHKAQGLSLDCARMSLGDLKNHGQGYVALSRLRRLDGLSISALNFDAITADPAVVAYYEYLSAHDTHAGFVDTMCKVVPPTPADLLGLVAKIPAVFELNERSRAQVSVQNASTRDFAAAVAECTGKGTKRSGAATGDATAAGASVSDGTKKHRAQ